MKIGIFDSGLGGLVIARAIFKKLPKYDYIYLGDTKRVPYGDQNQETIYKYTKNAINYLFKQNCALVIVACNTASAMALRRAQREYLPNTYPNRRILGVIIPTIEAIGKNPKKIGVLATNSTVESNVFAKELAKINSKVKIVQQSAPLLVPMIEGNAIKNIDDMLKSYIEPLKQEKVDDILLGCSHYPIVKDKIKKIAGKRIKLISQEDIIPGKLRSYLKKHYEINSRLSKKGKRVFEVTDKNTNFDAVAKTLFGKKINFRLVNY